MSNQISIFHKPKCSKSRQTLQLLKDNNIDPGVIEYLKEPPGANEIASLIDKLGIEPHELLRTKEKEYKGAGLSKDSSADEIIAAIAANPILLERPVVVNGDKAAIGRPPENVLGIL
ncbi:MAG: arsenate reductase (glutaredoxin) [Planctomycetota bacterium]|jgi:arsenate reductase|nr:arsenate reductase (glutaredoxin) [Planctomycetota bacterium]